MKKKQIDREIKYALKHKIPSVNGTFFYSYNKKRKNYLPVDVVLKFKDGSFVIHRLEKKVKGRGNKFVFQVIVGKNTKKN